ncbi:hypothetical protein [Roseomonas sp. KE2513]|uniref:hypothetical protein n=1 Tax=Roseomonas sp. KE2513 TaxID=2479202 RepID=UPI0018DF7F77|nr:hypothetical protein [Roseomonas sp. KE2513]
MLGEHAPVEARRAARRLRAEGAPAAAIDDSIADLARGLALSEVSHSPAVLDALPPLFWLEARPEDAAGNGGIGGWVVERKRGGLAIRAFSIGAGREAVPEAEGTATLPFGADTPEEGDGIRYVRGLVTAVGLPGVLAEIGESSPVVVMPADPSEGEAGLLRGFRLSVVMSPDAAPT